MANRVPLKFDYALVNKQGRATLAFQKFLFTVGNVTNEISDLQGDADDIADGVTRRILDVVDEVINRNPDGTISSITQTDPNTGASVATVDVSYQNGQITEIEVTESSQVTTSTLTYTGDLINAVDVSIGAL